MNFVKKQFEADEVEEKTYKFSGGAMVMNYIVGNLLNIIMWIALIATSFYFLLKLLSVSNEYWFVIIPPIGFVVVRLWTLVMGLIKKYSERKETGYMLTNKAIYYFNNGNYKSVKRIAFSEIIDVVKSDYLTDGFFVASNYNIIYVKDIKKEKELHVKMLNKSAQQKLIK